MTSLHAHNLRAVEAESKDCRGNDSTPTQRYQKRSQPVRNRGAVEILRRMALEHDTKSGAQIAAEVGMDPGLLYRKLNPMDEGLHVYASEVLPLTNATDSDLFIEWLASHRRGAFVPFSRVTDEMSGVDLVRESREMIGEFGEILKTLETIFEDDRIEAGEPAQFRLAILPMIQRLVSIQARLQQMEGDQA